MVETYTNKIHQMNEFIKSIDYNERTDTGMPIFKTKDTLDEMGRIDKALEALKNLEMKYKEEQEEVSGLRGDKKKGLFD